MSEEIKKSFTRAETLAKGLIFDPEKYEYKEDFVPGDIDNPLDVHTVAEMIECLKRHPEVELDARVICTDGQTKTVKRMDRKEFLERAEVKDSVKFRESLDAFASDDVGYNGGSVGQDFTPLVGGPFFKQLYQRDYLRMHASSFYAYHHDPIARAVTNIISDFTLGRGFRVDSKDSKALLLWNAFAKINNIEQMMEHISQELTIYGETMLYWLPNNQTHIMFNLRQGDFIPKGILPRVRVIDPSNIYEIITAPEDIYNVIAYQWLAPTQYQIFSTSKAPTSKFIFQQLPADQIDHFKINSVSNEKRGRSDYFPSLGYMKRLRDSINYSVISMQKAAAWSIDTTIEGNDDDIAAYIESQSASTIAPAGSEFVHTAAVKREYLSNSAVSKGMGDTTFNWCLNMICASTGIPVGYLGTHLQGGSTRASALVATEPVAKKLEKRQKVYERILQKMWDRLMETFGITADCEITFPELITQDRSKKIQDVAFAETGRYIAHERAAEMIAKELDISNFDYQAEQKTIQGEGSSITPEVDFSPLTMPPTISPASAISGDEKKAIKDNERNKNSVG